MKKMKSFIIAALAVAFMFVFAGCSKESDKFIGKWKTTLDFSKEVTDELISEKDMQDVAHLIKIEGYTFDYIWTFNEDGTYRGEITNESIDSAVKAFGDSMKKSYEELFRYTIEQELKDRNLDISVEEFLAQLYPGKTTSEIMKENEIDLDEIAKEVTDAMKMELVGKLREEGNFKVKDDKIFFSEGKDNEIDVNVYNTYEFTDDGKLKILEEVNPADEDNEFSEILPLIFEKIS